MTACLRASRPMSLTGWSLIGTCAPGRAVPPGHPVRGQFIGGLTQ